MRIAVIGSGHIGGTLTRRLAALGHDGTPVYGVESGAEAARAGLRSAADPGTNR